MKCINKYITRICLVLGVGICLFGCGRNKDIVAEYEMTNYNISLYEGNLFSEDLCVSTDDISIDGFEEDSSLYASALFDVSDVKPIQNLLENLLWILIQDTPNKRKMSQMTMALLFLQLLGHTETLSTDDLGDRVVWQVLRYVESSYADGSFAELAEQLHYDTSWLSREIKRKTGKTYTQLVQEKRLAQATFLLRNTDRNVSDIALAVGYENISYFHRIFADAYGKSPKHYRVQERTLF